jgi:transcriptional regulator with XRE-family HTH domain
MKRPLPEKARQMKEELYAGVEAGTLDMGAASRLMRKILGLSQREYAKRVLKISPRVLIDFERGAGNPTLATLLKIAAPFGLRVGFVRFLGGASPREEGSASRDEKSRDPVLTGGTGAKQRT